ncbi:MAG: bis(5'-nucleosyl)-tetraphosphatase (symmetrical) YqeK [Elusimicrobiota bacterium]
MNSISDIKKYLAENLTRQKYIHTLNITNLAIKLAKHYKLKNISKIKIAALLHDCQKKSPQGVHSEEHKNNHSILAEKVARTKFRIKDKQILNAIKYHTFGHRQMDSFSKIIYIADMSEPSRKFPEAKKIRKLAFKDLDGATILALSTKIKYVLDEKKPLSHESVFLYNNLLKKSK